VHTIEEKKIKGNEKKFLQKKKVYYMFIYFFFSNAQENCASLY